MIPVRYISTALAGVMLLCSGCVQRLIYAERESQSGSESDSDGPDDPSDTEPIQSGEPCAEDSECGDRGECFEGTCVGSGSFRVSLSWDVVSDFDLHVRTPSGMHIFFAEPEGAGGYLDVDDCVDGGCRSASGPHVENIFFESGDADNGRYRVWVENFDGRREGDFRIVVSGDVEHEWSGSLEGYSSAESDEYEFNW